MAAAEERLNGVDQGVASSATWSVTPNVPHTAGKDALLCSFGAQTGLRL